MRTLVFFVLIFSSALLSAQSPVKVVDDYLDAIGGKERLESVKTMQADIAVVSNGLKMEGMMAYMYPDKQYSEMRVRDRKIITVINGDQGWMINPMTGSDAVIPMPKEQLRASRKGLSAERLLYPDTYTLEDLGEQLLNGENYRVLKVVFKAADEAEQIRYFNLQTKLIDYVEMASPMGGNIIMAYKNYISVDGYKFPGTIETYTGKEFKSPSMVMNLSNMTFNAAVDPALFEKP